MCVKHLLTLKLRNGLSSDYAVAAFFPTYHHLLGQFQRKVVLIFLTFHSLSTFAYDIIEKYELELLKTVSNNTFFKVYHNLTHMGREQFTISISFMVESCKHTTL
jgi:hypothetical protein